MKKRYLLKFCAALLAVLFAFETPAFRVIAYADSNTTMDQATQGLLMTCLKEIYNARAEQERIAREYLGSVKTLAQTNANYNAAISAAEQRLSSAVSATEKAKYDWEHGIVGSDSLFNLNNYNASGFNAAAYNPVYYTGLNKDFPNVYLTPGLTTIPVSVKIPAKKAYNVIINGIPAFSIVSTGRPVDYNSMLGMVSFTAPYALYSKWHITANYYAAGQLVDNIELSGEVKDPMDFKPLYNFFQIWRAGVEAATFRIFVAENHSVMVSWDLDGSVTITDFNNFLQEPPKADTKTKNKQSSGSSNSQSASSGNSTNSSAGGNTASSGSSGSSAGNQTDASIVTSDSQQTQQSGQTQQTGQTQESSQTQQTGQTQENGQTQQSGQTQQTEQTQQTSQTQESGQTQQTGQTQQQS